EEAIGCDEVERRARRQRGRSRREDNEEVESVAIECRCDRDRAVDLLVRRGGGVSRLHETAFDGTGGMDDTVDRSERVLDGIDRLRERDAVAEFYSDHVNARPRGRELPDEARPVALYVQVGPR